MEHEFHRWLKAQAASGGVPQSIKVGIGDDAAILSVSDQCLVVTTDSIAESTHFDLAEHSLESVGRKSLAVNLSDLAAMAARPVAAVLSFLLPRSFRLEQAQSLYRGIDNLAREFDTAIIGGDTNTWDGPLVLGATLMGRRNPDQTGWSIDGIQPGDRIMVTGAFGGSIHGRHLTFTPRVELALSVASRYGVHAATDASDSLSLDLDTMASASGVGVRLNLDAVPISNDVSTTDRALALRQALTDGEDFELILALPPHEAQRLMKDPKLADQLTDIGEATKRHSGLGAVDKDGNWNSITPSGYEH